MKEHKRRSVVKGLSYRIFGTLVTIAISYKVTGSVKSSFSIGAIDVVSKIFLFYVHERAWLRVKWGRQIH
jgi:uncharacterized membrane protein